MKEKIRLGKYLRLILIIGDFAVINIAYLLVRYFTVTSPEFDSKWVWMVINVAYCPSIFLFSDIHKARILYADKLMLNACKSTMLYGITIIAIFYILNISNVGLANGLYFIILYFIFISFWWLASYKILKKFRRMGFNFRRTVVVGADQNAQQLISELHGDTGYGYKIMGVFDNSAEALRNFDRFYTAPIDRLNTFVKKNKIDIIFHTLDTENTEQLSDIMRISEELGIDFVTVPKFSSTLRGHFHSTTIGDLPVMVKMPAPLVKSINKYIKRLFDIVFSLLFLLVSPIIFIPVGIGVKLSSPGPIFFRQRRTGIYGKDFVCLKFRTMKVNAEADITQATENDPRKTKFGDFLRKTSIDELPQFVNVLLGNMSVVGPRPHMVSQTEDYSRLINKYMIRHSVKPGITGWAQVNGYRGSTKQLWQMEKRVEYDVWYIRNWNFFLDLKIIFRTVTNSFRGDSNAY